MVSKQMQNVIKLLRNRIQSMDISVKSIRAGLDLVGKMIKIPKDVKCVPVSADGVPAEWIITPEVRNENVILHLHGGGFIAGSIETHRDLAARISRVAKARVLLIDYRLAPEHPFPAGLNDAITAYKWLINTEGINPNNLIILGDSAGGGLTISCLVRLIEANINLPVAAICLSPGVDGTFSGESHKTKVELDPFLSPEMIKLMFKSYIGDADPHSPDYSILYQNLKGLPPLLIQVGTSEILLDDSVLLAERAKATGVDVKLEIYEDMIHVFQAFAAFAPESQEAIDKIGEFALKFLNK